jgi:signal transduction histidine kinase
MQHARSQGILFESVHVCKDGSCVPVEVSSRGVVIEGQDMLLSVIRDIRQRKETELTLRQAISEAERASQAKTDFLASMSHELRTPLNAIMGFSQVLENEYFGALTAKQKEYVNDVYESGRHLLSLINDILDLSKIEAGKMEPNFTRFNAGNLLENSRVLVKERCYKHGIRLDFDMSDPVRSLLVTADERRLKQILYNLLSNATKFTPDDGQIRLRARLTEEDVPQLEVSVADSGIGIDAEHQRHIFEAFYQVKQGTADKTPGTGLGLSLVKQLVALHGGRIWVESDGEGRGSRFTFVIPVDAPAAARARTLEKWA